MIMGENFLDKIYSQVEIPEEDKKTVVYGCLYMDTGECSWEYAEHQIDTCMSKQKKENSKIIVGFDLIADKNQIKSDKAKTMGLRILSYIDKKYPGVYARAVGLTKWDEFRPVRDILIPNPKLKDFLNSPQCTEKYFSILE